MYVYVNHVVGMDDFSYGISSFNIQLLFIVWKSLRLYEFIYVFVSK